MLLVLYLGYMIYIYIYIYIYIKRRPGKSRGKTLDCRPLCPGSIRAVGGGGDFSSLLRVQTGPTAHSASYKMNERAFPGGKGDLV